MKYSCCLPSCHTLTQIMKKLLFILILLITLTPLVLFEKLPFPFVTEKTLYFRLLVDILLVVWAIVAFRDAEYLPRKTPLNIALLGLGIVTFLTALFGHDFQSSFWSGLERMEGAVGLFYSLIFFFVLSNSLKKTEQWHILFLTSCGVACVVVLTGIFKAQRLPPYFNTNHEKTSIFPNSTHYAYSVSSFREITISVCH